MRASVHHKVSSTEAIASRMPLAHTGGSASLPKLMTRNVLPQIVQHETNASQTREGGGAAGEAAAAVLTAAPILARNDPWDDAARGSLTRSSRASRECDPRSS